MQSRGEESRTAARRGRALRSSRASVPSRTRLRLSRPSTARETRGTGTKGLYVPPKERAGCAHPSIVNHFNDACLASAACTSFAGDVSTIPRLDCALHFVVHVADHGGYTNARARDHHRRRRSGGPAHRPVAFCAGPRGLRQGSYWGRGGRPRVQGEAGPRAGGSGPDERRGMEDEASLH
jgi:hypothetical protein